jgi:hypothetical protein
MPRDEYQMPVDPFDKVANLGLESVVHDDLRRRLAANPQFADKAIEMERELVRWMIKTDPDLHAARRFAKQLETELEQVEAAVVFAATTKTETDFKETESWILEVQEEFPLEAAWALLRLQLSTDKDYLGWVEELLVGLLPDDRFRLLGQLYPLIDHVRRDELDEPARDMKARIVAGMRRLQPEIINVVRKEYSAIDIYRCTRLEEDRLKARHCARPLSIFKISGLREDWDLAIRYLDQLLLSSEIQDYLVLLIEAACDHRRDHGEDSVVSFSDLGELCARLKSSEYKARADIAMYHLTGIVEYVDKAYYQVRHVDPVQDDLQLRMVRLFCKASKFDLARQSAKHLSTPQASIGAFAAIYAAKLENPNE